MMSDFQRLTGFVIAYQEKACYRYETARLLRDNGNLELATAWQGLAAGAARNAMDGRCLCSSTTGVSDMDQETHIVTYPRMKYAYEQREWVQAADDNLVEMEALCAEFQRDAAEDYRLWMEAGPAEQKHWSLIHSLVNARYRDARALLFRCVYYKAMRQANLPLDE